MRVPDDKTKVAKRLMSPEFLFETSEQNLVQLQIRRNIAKDLSVDIMPILKKIYFSIQNGDEWKPYSPYNLGHTNYYYTKFEREEYAK